MSESEFILFHEDSFREFIGFWRDPDSLAESGFSGSYAAYHALAHAGFVSRARGSADLPAELAVLPTTEREALVSAACRFVRGFSLPGNIARALTRDALDADEIDDFEHVLLQRDELDVVIDLAKRLVGEALEESDVLLADLAVAVSIASELDDAILTRPDIVAVCSRLLIGVRPAGWRAPGPYPDWFAKARKWDQEFGSAELSDLLRVVSVRADEPPCSPTGGEPDGPVAVAAQTTGARRDTFRRLLRERYRQLARPQGAAISASPGGLDDPAADDLRGRLHPVVDDDGVFVMFGLHPAARGGHELEVELIGPGKARFKECRVGLLDGTVVALPFSAFVATMAVGDGDAERVFDSIDSVVVVDDDGRAHMATLD